MEFSSYPPGTFSWVDLATSDAAGAKAFYTELFGWEAVDFPAGPGVYTMLMLRGKPAAALYQMNPEQEAQGMPPNWLSYVTVESAEKSASKAASLGANVMVPAMDVMEEGRMAMLQDPTGAMFAVWEPKNHIGAHLANEPGAFGWNELATKDAGAASEFYTALFGWATEEAEMPFGTYTTFMNGERANGGMMQMTEEWGDMPSHWTVYFCVADRDASVKKAESLGATIHNADIEAEGVGKFAMLQDPQGAHLAIIQLESQPEA